MDRYFYNLEKDDKGNQIIHLSGNVYYNDGDGGKFPFRIAEWVGFEMDVVKAKEMLTENKFFDFFDFVSESVKYLGDLTEQGAREMCETYFNGTSGTKLYITDITETTPCGDYWFERRYDYGLAV